jgi:hypothetical protein
VKFWRESRRARATTSHSTSSQRPWKELYVEALVEANKDKVPALIAQAECAIAARTGELFGGSGDNIQEQEALGEALYALHALKTCLAVHGRFAETA